MDCNILLLGQTGVGKSSLLNYLAGKKLAKAGIASGVGGLTKGIHRYPLVINGQRCQVSDSEGFEMSNLKYWEKLIQKELSIHYDKGIDNWYHIVVFCIGANGGRVQDFELRCLKKMMKSGYGIVVAFTKADMSSLEDLASMERVVRKAIKNSTQVSIVNVCSIEDCSIGKEALCDAILKAWGKSLASRLPLYVFNPIFDSLESWRKMILVWISEQSIGFFGRDKEDVYDELKKMVKGKQMTLSNRLNKQMESSLSAIPEVFGSLDRVLNLGLDNLNKRHYAKKIEMPDSSTVFSDNGFWTWPFGGDKRRQEIETAFMSVYAELVSEYDGQQEAFARGLSELFD